MAQVRGLDCWHNQGVTCSMRSRCEHCGWYEPEDERRRAEIRKKGLAPAEEQKLWHYTLPRYNVGLNEAVEGDGTNAN